MPNLDKLQTDIHITLHNKQPTPAKTSHTHLQQQHQSHMHQVKVEDIKEEVDKTLQIPLKPKDNPTYKQRKALKKIIIHDTIIINKADKGSTIVIQDRDTYTQIGLDHLKDTTTYIYLNMVPTTTFLSRTSTPQLYFLKKTHKTPCLTDPLSAPAAQSLKTFQDSWTHKYIPPTSSKTTTFTVQ